MAYDDYLDDGDAAERQRRKRQEQLSALDTPEVHPGANRGSGPWAPGYDPGDQWNAGQPPQPGAQWNMGTNDWDVPKKEATTIDGRPPNPNIDTRPPTPPVGGGAQPTFLPAAQAAPAPIAQPTAKPPILDEATKILLERLKQLSQPFDPQQDDTYRKTLDAYGVGQERDARRQRRVAAERAAAGGYGSSGALDTRIRGIAERQGQNESMFAAQTANERLQQRDQQLVVAIQLARQLGQDDLANQLEQQRLRLSEVLGRGDLALRAELGRGNLGLGYDTLGFNYASLANSANRDAILALLGGG